MMDRIQHLLQDPETFFVFLSCYDWKGPVHRLDPTQIAIKIPRIGILSSIVRFSENKQEDCFSSGFVGGSQQGSLIGQYLYI